MSEESTDLDALERAINDAASKVGSLWVSFITFSVLLLITIGSVTHKGLLLESPLRLPIFNIDISIVGFFVLSPIFFLIFHFYTLLQLQGLSSKIVAYNNFYKLKSRYIKDSQVLRHRLDAFVLVQILAGTAERRRGFLGVSNLIAIWLTVIVLPMFIFLLSLLTFLPYHSESITWLIRISLLLDMAIVLIIWPRIFPKKQSTITRFFFRPISIIIFLIIGIFSVFVATFRGEPLHYFTAATRYLTLSLFESRYDLVHNRAGGIFGISNRLFLPGVDLGIAEKQKSRKENNAISSVSISFQGRNLAGAILIGSDLRDADFSAANLSGAVLNEAHLERTHFGCIQDTCSNLTEVRFGNSNLEDAVFNGGDLSDAEFTEAQLQGVTIRNVYLNNSSFIGAKLNGAILEKVIGEAASFELADMTGAHISNSSIDGADLSGTDLSVSIIQSTSMRGAFMKTGSAPGDNQDLDYFNKKNYTVMFSGAKLDKVDMRGIKCNDDDNCQVGFDLSETIFTNSDLPGFEEYFLSKIKENKAEIIAQGARRNVINIGISGENKEKKHYN